MTRSLFLMIGLTSCLTAQMYVQNPHSPAPDLNRGQEALNISGEDGRPETLEAFETAVEVLTAGKNRDYQLLAQYAHPEKGILFSPDAAVDRDEDAVFFAGQIREFDSGGIYDWGCYDAGEAPLLLTADEYFADYVYNKEFLASRQIGINVLVRPGNFPGNAAEAFPEGIFVEFHDEGTKEFSGLDWSSVKIVLEKYQGAFRAVAVISSRYAP